MFTERIIMGAGAAALLFLGAAVGWFAFNDPTEETRSDLAWDLQQAQERRGNPGEGSASIDFAALEENVVDRDDLWDQLISPPPERPDPPDLAGALRGVTVTRESMGSGEDMRVRIRTSSDSRGSWKGVGDEVNGCTIIEINSDAVVFGQRAHGRMYTRSVSRGN
ncbi:MAG: hypothetical protein ACLFU6_01910 [Candidatus Hydrogenedentota bacterium]